ncbi:MAG: hypothetical protein LBQ59_04615 [Candidatus Peribacteria bacterium]|nr:hypothetical protein [Candidatus Peribacteria bacterium]
MNYEVKIEIDEKIPTFAFSPKDRVIQIPISFLENFHENLLKAKNEKLITDNNWF